MRGLFLVIRYRIKSNVMPIGNAPQFKGVEAVVEGYINADIPAFAVCYAKDINFRYQGDSIEEGAELLRAWLLKLKEFESRAIYQLRLYEDLNGKAIRSNTAYDMAFKFVVNERDETYLPVRSENGAVSNSELISLLRELSELKAQNAVLQLTVEQYEAEDNEKEQQPTREQGGKSIGHALIEKFSPALESIGNRIVDAILPPATPQKVAGIVIETGNEDEERIIEQSIRRLRNAVPDQPGVAAVLMKLADMAERQPGQFNFYVQMLLTMKL